MANETVNRDKAFRRSRLNRLPYFELVEVVEDPHRGGKLVGRRGEIDGYAQTGERPYRYWIKFEDITRPLPFARRQLKPTGVPRIQFPPSPWTSDQIEAFVKHKPKAVWGCWESVLRRHARVEDIIKVLRESADPGVRVEICFFFDQTMLKSGREAILTTLFDPSPRVRYQAADAYAKIGRAEDGPIIMAAYRLERSEKVRSYLVDALGAIQCQAAAPMLITLLHAGKLRYSTIEALGELRGSEVRDALAAELETETLPGWRMMIKNSIAFVEARARRDAFEARGETVPRPLTAEQIEQVVLNPPPEIGSSYVHLLIHASEEELRKARDGSEHLKVRNVAELALEQIRHRDKRGY